MNIVIIEDEPQAAARLEKLLAELLPESRVVARIDTVKKAVQWFSQHPAPNLVLMDIQLADGISFEIFDMCDIKAPVIFITAYDEYALKAFKVNSLDYILKPVDKDELSSALLKFRSVQYSESFAHEMLRNIGQTVQMLMKKYKSRFVIKVGEHLKTVEVEKVRYFFTQDKATFCVTDENRNFILDYTMEQLEEMLDPAQFFRINRKYIVRASAIQDIIHYTNSRLRLVLSGSEDHDIIVARERVQEFKEWLDK
jgi:DNA-binding LytR/AlgR family response regulator